MDFSLRKLFPDPVNTNLSDFGNALLTIIDWMIALSGSVALVYMIYGGLLYLTSGGNSGQAESAKKTLTWAIIGFLIVISAYALVNFFSASFITENDTATPTGTSSASSAPSPGSTSSEKSDFKSSIKPTAPAKP